MAVLDRLVSLHGALVHTLVDGFEIRSGPVGNGPGEHLETVGRGPFRRIDSPFARQAGGSINERLARYDRVVGDTADRSERFVVTNGEPHRGNTGETADGVMLVDWDTVLLASPSPVSNEEEPHSTRSLNPRHTTRYLGIMGGDPPRIGGDRAGREQGGDNVSRGVLIQLSDLIHRLERTGFTC